MEFLNLDGPPCSRDTALELMVHHLQLAHMYYQACPNDSTSNKEEAFRLFTQARKIKVWKDDGGFGAAVEVPFYEDSPETVCGMAWIAQMEAIYKAMEDDD